MQSIVLGVLFCTYVHVVYIDWVSSLIYLLVNFICVRTSFHLDRQPEKECRRTAVSPTILQGNYIKAWSVWLDVLFVYMHGVSYELVLFGFTLFTCCFRTLLYCMILLKFSLCLLLKLFLVFYICE